jgi:hypothetical protein
VHALAVIVPNNETTGYDKGDVAIDPHAQAVHEFSTDCSGDPANGDQKVAVTCTRDCVMTIILRDHKVVRRDLQEEGRIERGR